MQQTGVIGAKSSASVVAMSPKRSRKPARFRWAAILGSGILLAVVGGSFFYWTQVVSAGKAPPGQSKQVADPVPVSVASVATQDVPINLTGLGTVQATFTVGIHSQIDGKLRDVLFTEGQRVNKGDLLAKIDPRLFQAALDQATAKKAQDVATLAGLEKDLVRFNTLGAKGFDTQQNIDNQQAKVGTTKALIAADDAAIETAQTQLDYTDIRAPSDGRMGVRYVDPGNLVRASDPGSIATLVQTQPTAVIFTLPAHTLDDVRTAQTRGSVQVVAFNQDNQRMLGVGTLATIDNVIDQATASYRIKATFANEDEKLWPGQFVNARLLVDTRNHSLVIPNLAVQRGPRGLFAWVVTEKNTAVARPIEVGPSVGDITIVTSGLAEGERVVTNGQFKLKIDSLVSVENSRPAKG
jgi:multidrug efflux system membrane fusion protein